MRTDFCDLLGIEHPIVAAPMGPDLTGPELVAAVSNAGAFLGKTEAWVEVGEPAPDASHGEPLVLAVQTPPLRGENI